PCLTHGSVASPRPRRGPVRPRRPRRPLRLPPAHARRRAGRLPGAVRRLGPGPSRRGDGSHVGLGDVLVGGRGGPGRLPQGAAVVFNAFGPRNALFEAAFADAAPVTEWISAACRQEALAPGSLGAQLWEAVDRGEITADQAPLLVRSLLAAGLDTTIYGLGNALYCLATNPDQYALLHADPDGLARAAFEETLRVESPVQTFFRTTTRPVDVAGIEIPDGAKALLFLGSANRDPRRWGD